MRGGWRMKKVRIGLAGAGFIAKIHMAAFREISEIVEVVGVCASRIENAQKFAQQYGIPKAYKDIYELCASPEIDVIDVCVPTNLHDVVILEAAKNGKHVICEKPLTGYFGEDRPEDEEVGKLDKKHMFDFVKRKVDEIEKKLKESGIKFMYAENLVYAPAVLKIKEMIKAAKPFVYELRAECSHSGSHAAYSRRWRTSGGGSLMRLGSHPIAVVLDIKHHEGLVRDGKPIRPVAVYAETDTLTKSPYAQKCQQYVVTGWEDVEDWSVLLIEFEDKSRAVVFSNDVSLGGVKNWLQLHTSKGLLVANITPNNSLIAYAPEGTVWKDVYIAEKLETSAGYSFPSPDEFWTRGYPQEMRDFVMSVIENRDPVSGFDLAKETALVIYAGYLSAQEGKKVSILE